MLYSLRSKLTGLGIGVLIGAVGAIRLSRGGARIARESNQRVGGLQDTISDQESAISDLEGQVASQGSTISDLEALLDGVSRQTVDGNETLRFSEMNVQVVNGTDSTDDKNGLGNLLIGYSDQLSTNFGGPSRA